MNKIEYFHRKDERNAQMHKEYLSIPDLNRIAEKFELSIPSARTLRAELWVQRMSTLIVIESLAVGRWCVELMCVQKIP